MKSILLEVNMYAFIGFCVSSVGIAFYALLTARRIKREDAKRQNSKGSYENPQPPASAATADHLEDTPEERSIPESSISKVEIPDAISSLGYEVWFQGLGALSRLEEEGDKVFRNLKEGGEDYEKKHREQIEDAASNLQEQQESPTEDMLMRIGIPTHDEIQDLSKKVGDLSSKMEALNAMIDAQREDVETVVYHVIPRNDGWAVMREGNEKATSVHETKKEALSAAREITKAHLPSQLIVHKQDHSV
jgi:hypothetical protein